MCAVPLENVLLTVEIATDNAAFDPEPGYELARILRDLADNLEQGSAPDTFVLRDVNGNKVGTATLAANE